MFAVIYKTVAMSNACSQSKSAVISQFRIAVRYTRKIYVVSMYKLCREIEVGNLYEAHYARFVVDTVSHVAVLVQNLRRKIGRPARVTRTL